MLEEYIKKLRPYVLELFKDDKSTHDITHLERTMRFALKIHETEGGDRLEIDVKDDFIEGQMESSIIHHVYHKLFKLKENMNTETGKKLAEQRTEFMKIFVDQFIDEWNGNK